jgi:acyl dehydratase
MVTQGTRTEPYVGQVVGPRDFTIDQKLLDDYVLGLGLAPRQSPPQMMANGADIGGSLLFSQQRGHLWLRQEWEFHRPLQFGATFRAEARVLDIYQRRERTVVLTETVLRDAAGETVSVQRHHQSFLLSNPEEVKLRDPKEKEGARSFQRPAGKPHESLESTVTLEMCGRFFHGASNYHSDKKASNELGFQDVVVGGRMTMGYVGELLDRAFGERWARTGRLLVKFTNVLWPDEAIRAQLISTGQSSEAVHREGVFAWVEKTDGTTVIVAEGSVER